jgi:hypothetical protein
MAVGGGGHGKAPGHGVLPGVSNHSHITQSRGEHPMGALSHARNGRGTGWSTCHRGRVRVP